MSYDLHFAVRPGGSEPSEQSLRAFFAARPHWTLDEDSAAYRNELTGVHINASFSQRSDDDPADRVARDALYAGFDTYNRYWHRV